MAALTRPAALFVADDAVPGDEQAVVRAAAAGDRRAFEILYRAHAGVVFALLTRLVGPTREREDLLQESFVRLHAALGRFRGECAVRTFVYQIATRVAIDHLRRRRPDVVDDRDLDAQIDPALTPSESAQQREDLTRALVMLAGLKPKQRVAFVLHEVMGLTHDEVGRMMGARAATVRMRVNAAKRTLARLAKEYP